MADNEAIVPPIVFTPFGEPSPVSVTTIGELQSIAAAEGQAWSVLAQLPRNHLAVSQAVNQQMGWVSALSQQSGAAVNPQTRPAAIAQMRSLLTQTQQTQLLYSKSRRATAFFALREKFPGAAAVRFAFLLGTQGNRAGPGELDLQMARAAIIDYLDSQDLNASIAAYQDTFNRQFKAFDDLTEGARATTANLQENLTTTVATAKKELDLLQSERTRLAAELDRSLSAMRENVSAGVDALRKNIDDAVEATRTAIAELKDQTTHEIGNFRAALRSELRLQAPVTYWRDKSKGHTRVAWAGLGAFVAAALIMIAAFAMFGSFEMDSLPKAHDGSLYLGELVVFTIPTVAYFWIMRYLGRLFVTNYTEAADARRRATMTETFLALAADGRSGVADAERLIILQALFRSGADAQADDTAPQSLFDVLLKSISGEKAH